MKRKIYLIDGNNFIYRMFFWMPEFATKDGKIVNAVFWMAKFFVNQLVNEDPDYIFFVKDARWGTFRDEIYSEYKATRERMPDNLRSQIGDIVDMIAMMEIPMIEEPWYEADDVIGTLAVDLWKDPDNEILILTWDKDLYSLVTHNVKIYDTMKRRISWIDETREKFGIEPNMIIDYLSIVWDSADNIPWIAGFWPKKAVTMINDIWNIEKVYDVLDSWNYENLTDDAKKIFKWKAIEKLTDSRDNAFLSKKLATICLDVPNYSWENKVVLEDYKFYPEKFLKPEIIQFFKDYEFHSLVPKDQLEKSKTWKDLWITPKIIWNDEQLVELKNIIKGYSKVVLDTETTWLDSMTADLVWVSIYLDDKNIYYINRLHSWPNVSDKNLHNFLDYLLQSDYLIIGHNIKYDLQIIELFLKCSNLHDDWEENNSDEDFWQSSLNF
jgi:DNA polymerase-1